MLNNAEVWHTTSLNKPEDLQVKLQIQVIEFEGRDNGRQRTEMGPRPGPATPPRGRRGALTFQD